MSLSKDIFDAGMRSHARTRELIADEVERRYNARERELDSCEVVELAAVVADPVLVEALRIDAWRDAGAKGFIPTSFPLGITAEIQWRYQNYQE